MPFGSYTSESIRSRTERYEHFARPQTSQTSRLSSRPSPPLGRRSPRRTAGEPGEELLRGATLFREPRVPLGGSEEVPVRAHPRGGIAGEVERDGAVEPDLMVTRSERQSAFEIRKCRSRPIALHLQGAEAVQGLGIARSQGDRALVGALGVVELAHGLQHVAQVVQGAAVARIELGGGLELM